MYALVRNSSLPRATQVCIQTQALSLVATLPPTQMLFWGTNEENPLAELWAIGIDWVVMALMDLLVLALFASSLKSELEEPGELPERNNLAGEDEKWRLLARQVAPTPHRIVSHSHA